ncbi:hypothetical protein VPHK251G3_0066 [Vibrio phage K251 g3]
MNGVIAAFIITVMVYMAVEYKQCEASGGTYVRGALWMQCIGGSDNG